MIYLSSTDMNYETPFFSVYLAGRPRSEGAGYWRCLSLSSVFSNSSVQDPNLQILLGEAEALRFMRLLSWDHSFVKPVTAQSPLPCARAHCPPGCCPFEDVVCSICPCFWVAGLVYDPDPL